MTRVIMTEQYCIASMRSNQISSESGARQGHKRMGLRRTQMGLQMNHTPPMSSLFETVLRGDKVSEMERQHAMNCQKRTPIDRQS